MIGRRALLGVAVLRAGLPDVSAMTDLDRALLEAAAAGEGAAVSRLLAAGADVEVRDANRRTALLVATGANRIEAAKRLIAAGADVNAKDNREDSPYLLAAASGHLEILRMTLARGADLKSVNRYGGTGLIPAAHYGHVDTVRELLGTSIDIDHVNRLGWTALLEAVILGDGGPRHTEIVRLLVAAGADVNLPDRSGVSPLAHARRAGQSSIVAILAGAGAR